MTNMCKRTGRQRVQYFGWISTLAVAVMLSGCDFSRVSVSCTEHIEAGDMGRFEDRGNGIVFDPQTQLEWYRCAVGQRYTERGCVGAPVRLAWSEVDAYLDEIAEKSGDSWRVPTGGEFLALAESQCINPCSTPTLSPTA